jgi:hypothetical protein
MSTDIDAGTTELVRNWAKDVAPTGAAVAQMVERLRRLEDEARQEGAGRQTLQKLMSARRVLGRLPAMFATE